MTIEDVINQTKDLGIQMQPIELFEIAQCIKSPMNVLVFGLGNDSAFWHNVNKNGRTVFIEDKKKWFKDITEKYPFLEAYKIKYDTKREDWKNIIDRPDQLIINIPNELKKISWDVIIVDGPAGHDDSAPGRMKSIYTASILIKNGGAVFVHDAHREVEDAYCRKYLLDKNFVGEVKGSSILRHYVLR
ncbi:MAG: hypothetical protein WCG28_04145 [bacterium]